MKKFYILDAHGFIYRAYHALPPLTSPHENLPIGAVYGFMNMLLRLIKEQKPDYICAAFDSNRLTMRHATYADYKGNRSGSRADDLKPQFELVHQLTKAMGIRSYIAPGYEADDIIATIAGMYAAADLEIVIVSSDKDFCQLISSRISMYDPMKSAIITREDVIKKFGVPPEQMADMMALWGDVSDNIPGVPGIGLKGAAELINQCGDLEGVLRYADEIPQRKRRENLLANKEQARLSRELVTLNHAVPIDIVPLDFFIQKDYVETLWEFAAIHEFQAVLNELTEVRRDRQQLIMEG